MIPIYYVVNQNELSHHGILGMRWGIRRYQNKDGTRTAEGKRRARTDIGSKIKSAGEKTKNFAVKHKTGLTRAAVAAGIAGTAIGLHYIGKNKAKDKSVAAYARAGANQIIKGTKSGVKEGFESGSKKAISTLIVGGTMLGTKKIADLYMGKDVSGKIFSANNGKKIDSFWKYKEGGSSDGD